MKLFLTGLCNAITLGVSRAKRKLFVRKKFLLLKAQVLSSLVSCLPPPKSLRDTLKTHMLKKLKLIMSLLPKRMQDFHNLSKVLSGSN